LCMYLDYYGLRKKLIYINIQSNAFLFMRGKETNVSSSDICVVQITYRLI
jgi:hypothetical protein